MSDHETPVQPTLWGENPTSIRLDRMEKSVIRTLDDLNAEKPFQGPQIILAEICRSLARNIDMGNAKGRAISNEAERLTALLDRLAGVEADDIDPTSIHPDTQRLMDVLSTAPRLDPTATGYPEEL